MKKPASNSASNKVYRVEIKKSAQKTVAKAPREIQKLLGDAMRKLGENPRPHGYTKMEGTSDAYYRIPVREWRIIYTIEDDRLLVLVVRVGQRKDVYKDFRS